VAEATFAPKILDKSRRMALRMVQAQPGGLHPHQSLPWSFQPTTLNSAKQEQPPSWLDDCGNAADVSQLDKRLDASPPGSGSDAEPREGESGGQDDSTDHMGPHGDGEGQWGGAQEKATTLPDRCQCGAGTCPADRVATSAPRVMKGFWPSQGLRPKSAPAKVRGRRVRGVSPGNTIPRTPSHARSTTRDERHQQHTHFFPAPSQMIPTHADPRPVGHPIVNDPTRNSRNKEETHVPIDVALPRPLVLLPGGSLVPLPLHALHDASTHSQPAPLRGRAVPRNMPIAPQTSLPPTAQASTSLGLPLPNLQAGTWNSSMKVSGASSPNHAPPPLAQLRPQSSLATGKPLQHAKSGNAHPQSQTAAVTSPRTVFTGMWSVALTSSMGEQPAVTNVRPADTLLRPAAEPGASPSPVNTVHAAHTTRLLHENQPLLADPSSGRPQDRHCKGAAHGIAHGGYVTESRPVNEPKRAALRVSDSDAPSAHRKLLSSPRGGSLISDRVAPGFRRTGSVSLAAERDAWDTSVTRGSHGPPFQFPKPCPDKAPATRSRAEGGVVGATGVAVAIGDSKTGWGNMNPAGMSAPLGERDVSASSRAGAVPMVHPKTLPVAAIFEAYASRRARTRVL
jgi:hypothetical protein